MKYNGLSKNAYYTRLRTWTLTLYDKDGNPFLVNPKFVMRKDDDSRRNSNEVSNRGSG